MQTDTAVADWTAQVIKKDQIARYMREGADFIDDGAMESVLRMATPPDASRVRDILAKSLAIQTLTPGETAELLAVEDPQLALEMEQAASAVKRHVYDNRIVTFAPLYLSTKCVNNCAYCGLRSDNRDIQHRQLSLDEIRSEIAVLAGSIGHKRLIAVYGEHPRSDILKSMEAIYSVTAPTRRGEGRIRRINVNAAPLSIENLRLLKDGGIGTYQVFQETYHHPTYSRVHPAGTLKGDYAWRLYAMHRALEAGIDDVGIGALFGLYDWRFEVMGILRHAIELEGAFGIGPHTISFPRIEPASGTAFSKQSAFRVSDRDFRRAVTVLRLAVPYAGMILTARENAELRRELLPLGITQTDASSRIGVGAYSGGQTQGQEVDRQQFLLGDTRSLDEVVGELARMGFITSFCTAGYRCGRTGKCIMELLRSGQEGKFCKLNAVLTFREWLDDFASEGTLAEGEKIIAREIGELREKMPHVFPQFMDFYRRIAGGERDLCF
jgi:2-iminoacetate synthase